ncbi:hypothetical protein DPEC_G00316860 [Dallia pectoralis]|uniref:Uncharacterized protein n=1 Tax=Dallia pectoralis TaxID=75939 RepID=A0ACC2FCU4_DALPE|nr:hypothetical protein DPEC_G00316860 [Dallia pectoralis]
MQKCSPSAGVVGYVRTRPAPPVQPPRLVKCSPAAALTRLWVLLVLLELSAPPLPGVIFNISSAILLIPHLHALAAPRAFGPVHEPRGHGERRQEVMRIQM